MAKGGKSGGKSGGKTGEKMPYRATSDDERERARLTLDALWREHSRAEMGAGDDDGVAIAALGHGDPWPMVKLLVEGRPLSLTARLMLCDVLAGQSDFPYALMEKPAGQGAPCKEVDEAECLAIADEVDAEVAKGSKVDFAIADVAKRRREKGQKHMSASTVRDRRARGLTCREAGFRAWCEFNGLDVQAARESADAQRAFREWCEERALSAAQGGP